MGIKISQMDAAAAFLSTDIIPIVDNNGNNKKATGGQIKDFIAANIIDDNETSSGAETYSIDKITNLYNALDGKISSIGSMTSASTASSNPVTCATGTYTECVNITLNAGLYLFLGMLAFESNATNVRLINISTSSGDTGIAASRLTVNACASGQTRFQTVTVISVANDNTTFYLNAYQNTGGNLDVIYSNLTAIKILA